ncbi:MAG: GAF domain-containing protein [Myxococcales bacterium]|nr:GAF domain-containing protein [Myxococcales bacterium]
MSGFSIELLEDGYRAVDPLARLRYVVRRAPDDAVLTGAGAAPAAPAPAAPAPAAPPAAAKPVESAPIPASTIPDLVAAAPVPVEESNPAPAPLPPAPTSSSPAAGGPPRPSARKSSTLAFSSSGSAEVSVAQPAVKPAPPLPSAANGSGPKAPSVPPPAPQAKPSTPPPAPQAKPAAPAAAPVAPPAPAAPAAPPPAPVAAAPAAPAAAPRVSAVPPTQPAAQLANDKPSPRVLLSREQDPTAQSPLSYREYAYFVPPGTSEPDAESILRAELERVKQRLTDVKPGKLVNLAAFDVEFSGKPPVPPIAALTWKDWKNETAIVFPRSRTGASVPPSAPASAPVPPPASAAPAPPQAPRPPSVPPPPMANPGPRPAGDLSKTDPMANAPPLPLAATQVAATQVAAPQVAAPQVAATANVAPLAAQRFTPGEGVPAIDGSKRPSRPPGTGSTPPPATATAQRLAEVGQIPVRPSSGRFMAAGHQKGRVSGDELLTALFEAMHDLHFLRDSLEGGEFCLQLANDMLPSRAGIVHAYDMNKREYVVASASGDNTRILLAKRTADADPMIGAAMRARRSIVVPDAAHTEAATLERYRALGGAKSVVIAPVMWGGRALGAIELLNPVDGAPFREDEGHAMSYIAEQFAEFIGSHGLVIEPDKILARAK